MTETLTLIPAGIDTFRPPVVYMTEDCHICRAEGFAAQTRVRIDLPNRWIVATLNVVASGRRGGIGQSWRRRLSTVLMSDDMGRWSRLNGSGRDHQQKEKGNDGRIWHGVWWDLDDPCCNLGGAGDCGVGEISLQMK